MSEKTKPPIVVLGAGMAGLGAAHRLRAEGVESILYDKKPYAGGHAASFLRPTEKGDCWFDDGPHISFTRDERLQALFAEAVDGEFETLHTYIDNLWRGHRLKHPAICNLYSLPADTIIDVIRDFTAAKEAAALSEEKGTDEPTFTDYAEWLKAVYGKTYAEQFPMLYGRKYHTAPAEAMTTDWLGPRLYRPDLEEVLRGALEPETPDVHYVSHFRYPTHGGFQAFLGRFVDASRIELNREVCSIDPDARILRFTDGREIPYDHLVSSLPLPELIPRIEGAPDDVKAAARRLACTTCILVDLAVDRADVSKAHWTYCYDEDLVFTRVSFPHLLSPNNAPEGVSTIQAELYFSDKYRPLGSTPEGTDPADHIEPTLRDLERCGILHDDDRILLRHASRIPWANIIFDHDRLPALETIFGYLEEKNIATAGRYGRWGYHWTDESFTSGEQAAEWVLDRLGD